jgi:hypothetical protein
MSYGYLYCFSNESMPGILKVGMTKRTPEIRLNESNSSDTWKPPTHYKIELAKKVLNPKQKEITLHTLLSRYTERINDKREFFRISIEEVKTFFDLIDGDLWHKSIVTQLQETKTNLKSSHTNEIEVLKKGQYEEEQEQEGQYEEEQEQEGQYETHMTISNSNMNKYFMNGQLIRHTIISINNTWISIYDSSKNGIIYNRIFYKSLLEFTEAHYSQELFQIKHKEMRALIKQFGTIDPMSEKHRELQRQSRKLCVCVNLQNLKKQKISKKKKNTILQMLEPDEISYYEDFMNGNGWNECEYEVNGKWISCNI